MVVDIGTGDGLYVYRAARVNPQRFFIGIDANRRLLEKISEKIYRKPSKGGMPNVLYVQSAVEDLPSDLEGIADEVTINFPWGSLLTAVAGGNPTALSNLRRICSAGAQLKLLVGIDLERDRAEIDRLGLPSLSLEFIDSTLNSHYRDAGFEIVESRIINSAEWSSLETSWARRLKSNANRSVIYIVGRAMKAE